MLTYDKKQDKTVQPQQTQHQSNTTGIPDSMKLHFESMGNIFSSLIMSDEEFEASKKADNEDYEWGKMLDLQENEEKVFGLKCEDGSVVTFKR